MVELHAAGSAAVTAAAAQYSIVDCFERAAAAHRSRTAILSNLWQPTYDELNRCANRLAHKLLARPGAAGDRVGILMDNDSPLLAALLAVLRRGGLRFRSDRTAFQDSLRASLNGEVQMGSDPALFNRTYQIEDLDGHEYILSSIGDAYRVEQNRMQGNIDGVFTEDETIQFKGWAVEPYGNKRAQTIAVFLDHRYLGCGATSERRPDVVDKLAAHSALYAGFNLHFKRKAIADIIGKPRVFVLSKGGSAAELTSAA